MAAPTQTPKEASDSLARTIFFITVAGAAAFVAAVLVYVL
jgi:hypothetical protein